MPSTEPYEPNHDRPRKRRRPDGEEQYPSRASPQHVQSRHRSTRDPMIERDASRHRPTGVQPTSAQRPLGGQRPASRRNTSYQQQPIDERPTSQQRPADRHPASQRQRPSGQRPVTRQQRPANRPPSSHRPAKSQSRVAQLRQGQRRVSSRPPQRGAGLPLPTLAAAAALLLVIVVVAIGFGAITRKPAASGETGSSQQTGAPGNSQQPNASQNATAEPTSVEIMMIGDVLMHDEIIDSGAQSNGSYNFDFVYKNIKDYIDAADVRILNQETVMGDPSNGHHLTMGAVGPIMNTPTALADTEADYGFNVILKATNHTYDLGYDGLSHELNYWKANYPKMPVIGVNNPGAKKSDDSQDYVNNVYVGEFNGMKIGFLNYTWDTNEHISSNTDSTYISYLDKDKIRKDVEKAREAGAEMLIACPHWGIEYDTTPSEEEMTYSKLFCELGVDVIFGAHPHILQPVELLENEEGHKTVCFFSMGNYVAASLMSEDSLIGGIARATLQRNADGTYAVTAASLVPTVICHTVGPHMSAFPLSSWTTTLAAESSRPNLTPNYAKEFCANLFGKQFDQSKGVCTLDVEGKARLV